MVIHVYPSTGPARLSTGYGSHPLRLLSDRTRVVGETLKHAEDVGISFAEGKCYCGQTLFELVNDVWEDRATAHMDHILPASLGHLATAGQLHPACESCNLRKGARPLSLLTSPDGARTVSEEHQQRIDGFVEEYYFSRFPQARTFAADADAATSLYAYVGTVANTYERWAQANLIREVRGNRIVVEAHNEQYVSDVIERLQHLNGTRRNSSIALAKHMIAYASSLDEGESESRRMVKGVFRVMLTEASKKYETGFYDAKAAGRAVLAGVNVDLDTSLVFKGSYSHYHTLARAVGENNLSFR